MQTDPSSSRSGQVQVGLVAALWRYPVKSMMGEELNSSGITDRGLLGDRQFAVVDRATGKVGGAKNPRKWGNFFNFRATGVRVPPVRLATSVPALRVAVAERAGRFWDDAEQQPGGIAHDPPGVHLLYSFGTKFLQPGHLGGQVVGVDVDVYPGRPVLKPLDEQAELLAGQLSSVIFGISVVRGQRLAGSRTPERQLTVVTGRRHVNHDLGQPAVVRHGANLRDRAARLTFWS